MKYAGMMLLLALLPAACIDDGGYNPGPSNGPVYCGQFTSCGTCTPVLGCGWCSMGSKGACVDQPNACADVANFYWTWELDGCPGAGDAGAAGGGPDAGATD
jgi:hypothetical protein